MNRKSWPEIGLLYCAAIWGATFYVVKDALDAVDPITLVAYRFLLAAALMLPWVIRRPGLAKTFKPGICLAVLLGASFLTQTMGLAFTTASNSGFITGMFIVFIPLFSLMLFKIHPNKPQLLSIALALLGLFLLSGMKGKFNPGDGLTLIAAAAYAGHLLAIDRFVRRDDAVLLTFHQFWMVGVLSLSIAVLTGRSFIATSSEAAWVIAFLAVLPTLSAFYILSIAQKHATPMRTAMLLLLEPVFAAGFAWTLGKEGFGARQIIGGGLIVAAMLLAELARGDYFSRLRGKTQADAELDQADAELNRRCTSLPDGMDKAAPLRSVDNAA